MKKLTLLFICLCISQKIFAQCPFNPTINGDTILCPNSTEMLSTQEYDAYQWYKRGFNDTIATVIPGDTMQTITINSMEDVLFYFSVEATLDDCTEFSPEVLIDGWAFLPVSVVSSGEFTVGMNGESIVCFGDTMYFTINLPYDTNITWFKNGTPISGATSTVLPVTTPGEYTVTGAPGICPDFIQSLGLILEVTFIECSTATDERSSMEQVLIYPNPVLDQMNIESEREAIKEVLIYNNIGKLIHREMVDEKFKTIDVSSFGQGLFFMEAKMKHGKVVRRFFIGKK